MLSLRFVRFLLSDSVTVFLSFMFILPILLRIVLLLHRRFPLPAVAQVVSGSTDPLVISSLIPESHDIMLSHLQSKKVSSLILQDAGNQMCKNGILASP